MLIMRMHDAHCALLIVPRWKTSCTEYEYEYTTTRAHTVRVRQINSNPYLYKTDFSTKAYTITIAYEY
eukprot:scaffold162861_cov17-Prasinocladus_malaysianus.AAC.1